MRFLQIVNEKGSLQRASLQKRTVNMITGGVITRGMITGDGMFYWRCYGATAGIDQSNYGICRMLIGIAIQADSGYMPGGCLKNVGRPQSGHNQGTIRAQQQNFRHTVSYD